MPYIKELSFLINNMKSTRDYDATRKIPVSTIQEITSLAHMTPSSYKLEPWKILVINDEKVKAQLTPIMNNQKQVATCSSLFILLNFNGQQFNTNTTWFEEEVCKKRNFSAERYQSYLTSLKPFFLPENAQEISNWAKNQTFILLQNLLLIFGAYEIDNVPIGGFKEAELISFLETNNYIEKGYYEVAVAICAGYGIKNDYVSFKDDKSNKTKIV